MLPNSLCENGDLAAIGPFPIAALGYQKVYHGLSTLHDLTGTYITSHLFDLYITI